MRNSESELLGEAVLAAAARCSRSRDARNTAGTCTAGGLESCCKVGLCWLGGTREERGALWREAYAD